MSTIQTFIELFIMKCSLNYVPPLPPAMYKVTTDTPTTLTHRISLFHKVSLPDLFWEFEIEPSTVYILCICMGIDLHTVHMYSSKRPIKRALKGLSNEI